MSLTVQPRYFDAIYDGSKTIEGRIAKQKYKNLKSGDTVVFRNTATDQTVEKSVVRVDVFPTFEAMLRHSGVQPFGLSGSIEDARDVYYGFSDYQNEEKEHGVVAIHIN